MILIITITIKPTKIKTNKYVVPIEPFFFLFAVYKLYTVLGCNHKNIMHALFVMRTTINLYRGTPER